MNKIINFHDVRDIAWFDRIITILKNKYTMVDVNQLEGYYYDGKILKNACHITIDDGDKTFYNVIYPVLKKHSVPATIFVSPTICKTDKNFWFQEIRGYNQDKVRSIISEHFNLSIETLRLYSMEMILKNFKIDDIWFVIETYKKQFKVVSKEAQNMNLYQILEIEKYGLVTIGAHTLIHPILANESDDRSKSEISNSIVDLGSILGHDIKTFAYPNGIPKLDFGQREIDNLKNNNCKIAFSTEPKNFTLNDNPLSIPRFGLSRGNEFFVRAKLALGAYWPKIKELKSKGEKTGRLELKSKIVIRN